MQTNKTKALFDKMKNYYSLNKFKFELQNTAASECFLLTYNFTFEDGKVEKYIPTFLFQ